MKTFLCAFALTTVSLASPCAQTKTQFSSLYTDLSAGKCKTIKVDEEAGSSVQKCPGVGGFSLLVADDDARMSVTVITPDGREHPLDYWEVITPAFSTLGEKAEWRVVRRHGEVVPTALIVRVVASEQENHDAPRKRSYLAVAKITSERICVTDKIKPAADANERARRAADDSADKACLKP